jgi:ATP-dependent helicase/nuclease subunit A
MTPRSPGTQPETQPEIRVSDAQQRVAALDPTASFLAQAPAGSGKTELLSLRYLSLLPTVDEPEQVLAITFTRRATAEMRARVLEALEAATRAERAGASGHEREVRRLAQGVLAHAKARGWHLLEQPQRLNIQTIDALALRIAYQTPLLSRLGGQLNPVDEADALYTLAAERTFAHLGDPGLSELDASLRAMLSLRDAGLMECESLIAGMLAKRDQWSLLLPGVMQLNPPWHQVRDVLEAPFQREHEQVLAALHQEFRRHPGVLEEVLELAQIAQDNGQAHLSALRGLTELAQMTDAEHWLCLCALLLKADDDWRQTINARVGFPAKTHRESAARLEGLIQQLTRNSTLLDLLCRARKMPPATYSEEEWTTVRSIFVVLRQAMAELRVIFAEEGAMDFAEAGLSAHHALQDPGVLMRMDDRFRHLLVDEFQDTSRPHFQLLRTLLQDWQPEDGRTCFLVGDPMQSIYLFRDAESSLFDQVQQEGLALDGYRYPLTTVQLSTNFRSTPAVVQELNDIFGRVLVEGSEEGVAYAPSTASRIAETGGASPLQLHVHPWQKDVDTPESVSAAAANQVMEVVRAHLPAIEQAERDGGKYRVAVLVRARPHLVEIIERLRREGIRFRGVKIDLLRDRPEILDLLSLLRALLHPADRAAWLSVLRAPWCGLTIPALHAICGDPPDEERSLPVGSLLRAHAEQLDPDSRQRALHVLAILEQAQSAYALGALAASPAALCLWLERTWRALGGPRYLNPEALANTEAFFSALAEMPPSSFGTLDESFNRRLEKLFAEPDPLASERCGVQLMTIHAAKGLEFEVVLIPHLQKTAKNDDSPLFRWVVRRQPDTAEEELLLAPLGRKVGDQPALYSWVGKKVSNRLRQEEKRLLYVACSRAIRELHLFTALERKQDGELCRPGEGTLLRAGWDGLEGRMRNELAAHMQATGTNLFATPGVLDALATTANGNSTSHASAANGLVNITAAPPQKLLRLPSSAFPEAVAPGNAAPENAAPLIRSGDRAPRPKSTGQSITHDGGRGNRVARVQGIVLHALLQQAASGNSGARPDWSRLTTALLRQHAPSTTETSAAHGVILRGLENALQHEDGRWLLTPRASSYNERSWTSLADSRVLLQRPDLVFLAGATPQESGSDYLWIIDYKTAALAVGEDREAFLSASRERYREQLEQYSDLFRRMDGTTPPREHRLALYHPLLPWLDWWAA